MVAPRKESDRPDRPLGTDPVSEGSRLAADGSVSRRVSGGLPERIRDALRGEGDEDLIMERGDVDNAALIWLRALDSQVIGACRADERLRPLPKLKPSSVIADDGIVAHLSEHFEASEVSMIARCLCLPLVSVRVGKIDKEGTLLCPTSTRGHLNLILLPSSNMRITFSGDDGFNETLFTLSDEAESLAVTIEEISSDSSGRSFSLKLPGPRVSYFWCSEKSKIHGMQLLSEMKELVRRKPCLCDLTGISNSRLDSFAMHLRACLVGSANALEAADSTASSSTLLTSESNLDASHSDVQSSALLKPSRVRLNAGHTSKFHNFCQESLSAKPNTFKEGMVRSYALSRNGARERIRRRGDAHASIITSSHQCVLNSASTSVSLPNQLSGIIDPLEMSTLRNLLCLSNSITSTSHQQLTDPSSVLLPQYCFCPLSKSLPLSATIPHLSSVYSEPFPLPPSSTLMSVVGNLPSLSSDVTNYVSGLAGLDVPTLFPEPLMHFPVSPLISLQSSQQITTFTPLMSDPIVHIPVIEVCAGEGYLVTAGPAVTSALAPQLSVVRGPLIPETESLVEKNARETLRMLMASPPVVMATDSELMNVLPAVLDNTLTQDVDAVASLLKSLKVCCAQGIMSDGCGSTGVDQNLQEDLEGALLKDDSLTDHE